MRSPDVLVKVTTEHPDWPLLRQTPGSSGTWGRYRFAVNEPVEECDYWVVFEGLPAPETVQCRSGATLLVTWEPPAGVRPAYEPGFLQQFGQVLTCHPRLRHPRVSRGQQGHPWFVGRSYDELRHAAPPAKTVPLVIITSDKAFSRGHRQRFEFALALKERFGDDAQLVGRGIADFKDKWDVLAPARYAVAAENGVFRDWLTEKLPDCYLTGTFPLYHGAPNADRYFARDSFAAIDVADLDGSTRRIEALLSDEDHFPRSQPVLAKAKARYLDELQLFPLLASLIEADAAALEQPRTAVSLRPEPPAALHRRLVNRWVSR
ncbi:MAG: hypothetical protein JJD92_04275 [Frankiaceae bacterium]|nr:hypothetical protein [Frankiaceae bacterium]